MTAKNSSLLINILKAYFKYEICLESRTDTSLCKPECELVFLSTESIFVKRILYGWLESNYDCADVFCVRTEAHIRLDIPRCPANILHLAVHSWWSHDILLCVWKYCMYPTLGLTTMCSLVDCFASVFFFFISSTMYVNENLDLIRNFGRRSWCTVRPLTCFLMSKCIFEHIQGQQCVWFPSSPIVYAISLWHYCRPSVGLQHSILRK